jgi:NAD(P)-dependent dehydrogenase (short-subunit alcohol dehydrogenase family)
LIHVVFLFSPAQVQEYPAVAGPRLEGRTCLIVGGTGGIGLASARRFVEEGARVVVTGRTEEEAKAARAKLPEVHAVAADATTPDAVAGLFREAIGSLGGRLDVLFHVAGISGRRFGDGPLHECTEAAWDSVLQTNAKTVFLTNQAAVRQMRDQSVDAAGLRGTILNVGSALAWSPSPDLFGTYAYAASKGAICAMTLASAARYARERIRFNVLAPGLIDTPMAARAMHDPAILHYLATKQPMVGGAGTAADCAEAALYLCEPASRLVTGTILTVDGGWCISEGQHAPPAEAT